MALEEVSIDSGSGEDYVFLACMFNRSDAANQ